MPTKPKVKEAVADTKEENQPCMVEGLRGMMLATIGAAAIAREEVEELVDRLVERGEIVKKDGKKRMREMMEERRERATKVKDEIGKQVERGLDRMNVVSKADVEALSQKIATLSNKIDELMKS